MSYRRNRRFLLFLLVSSWVAPEAQINTTVDTPTFSGTATIQRAFNVGTDSSIELRSYIEKHTRAYVATTVLALAALVTWPGLVDIGNIKSDYRVLIKAKPVSIFALPIVKYYGA